MHFVSRVAYYICPLFSLERIDEIMRFVFSLAHEKIKTFAIQWYQGKESAEASQTNSLINRLEHQTPSVQPCTSYDPEKVFPASKNHHSLTGFVVVCFLLIIVSRRPHQL